MLRLWTVQTDDTRKQVYSLREAILYAMESGGGYVYDETGTLVATFTNKDGPQVEHLRAA